MQTSALQHQQPPGLLLQSALPQACRAPPQLQLLKPCNPGDTGDHFREGLGTEVGGPRNLPDIFSAQSPEMLLLCLCVLRMVHGCTHRGQRTTSFCFRQSLSLAWNFSMYTRLAGPQAFRGLPISVCHLTITKLSPGFLQRS